MSGTIKMAKPYYTIYNLSSNTEYTFSKDTPKKLALAYAHYLSIGDGKEFMDSIVEEAAYRRMGVYAPNTNPKWMNGLTFIEGKRTISLGDWCCNKE